MFFGSGHAPPCRAEEKEDLPGELRLGWAHRIWGEQCVLGQENRFAEGLSVSAIFWAISETFAAAASVLMAAMSFQ